MALDHGEIKGKECEGNQRTPDGIYTIDSTNRRALTIWRFHMSSPEPRVIDLAAPVSLKKRCHDCQFAKRARWIGRFWRRRIIEV
jgi:hypothetical protein